MKRKLKGLLGVVTAVATLLSTFGTIPAMAAEKTEVENNDSMDKAMLISVNEEVTGNISDKNDKDYYKFELPADGYISLTFSHGYADSSGGYWGSYIFDSDGNNVVIPDTDKAYQWYFGNIKDDSTGIRIGLPKGSYYVKITPSAYWSSVDYFFTVNYTESSAYETEFNDTVKTADDISVNTEIGGNINYSDDVDYYKFDISEDGYISLTFSHGYADSSVGYWESYIFDSDGNSVIPDRYYEWYFGNIKDDSTGIRIGLPKGSYYVKITPSAHWSSVDYSFTVNYTESSAYEREGNDTIKQANDVAVNTKTGGGIMTKDDADWYRFSIPEDGNISVTFGHDYYKDAWANSSYYKIWFNDVDGNN